MRVHARFDVELYKTKRKKGKERKGKNKLKNPPCVHDEKASKIHVETQNTEIERAAAVVVRNQPLVPCEMPFKPLDHLLKQMCYKSL